MNVPATPVEAGFFERLSHSTWLIVLLAIGCVLAWDWLVPLKVLVVFFHEASHALAAVLTGGTVVAMHIVPNQGGEVQSLGGIPWIIASAGYLGSLSIGVVILLFASHSAADRWVMGFLAMSMAVVTLVFVRNGYGFGFGLLTSAIMLLSAIYLANWINDAALKCIGVMSILYVPWDICSDTLLRSELRSDARILAELIGGTTVMWGAIWLLISIVVGAAALWLSHQKEKPVLSNQGGSVTR